MNLSDSRADFPHWSTGLQAERWWSICLLLNFLMRVCMQCRGDPVEAAFYANLIEDKTSAGTSYVDFLVAVHRSIANMNR